MSDREAAHPYSLARLRRSAAVFLGAKGVTAPLNLFTFLLVSARLPTAEFALYAWLLAFGLLSQQLSTFGLNWVAVHYVPYYRSRVGGRSFRLFLLGLVALRCLETMLLVAAYYVLAPTLVAVFGEESWLSPLRLYLVVLAGEVVAEFLRTCIFEPLLEQGLAQSNVLLQHLVFLGGLLLALSVGTAPLSISAVLYARVAAFWTVLLLGLTQLAYLLRQPTSLGGEPPLRSGALLRFALDNWTQEVTHQASGGPLLTMLGSRLVGVPALATFGFAQNLADALSRALPAQLFIGLLRPRVIAAYVSERNFGELYRRIALILKVSNCGLAAFAAVMIAVGRPALDLMSAGKYAASYGLILAFIVWLALSSLQRMQSVLANVLGRSDFLRRASLSSLLVVPIAVALVYSGAGSYGLVVGMIAGDAVLVWLVSRQLHREAYHLPFDTRGYVRIAAATLLAAIIGRWSATAMPPGSVSIAAAGAITLATFLAALRALHPFVAEERRAIENLLGRKLVVW